MLLNLKLFQLLIVLAIIFECTLSLTLNELKQINEKKHVKKRETLASMWANKIVRALPDYYKEYYLRSSEDFKRDSYIDSTGNCSNKQEIHDYFLNVYSNDTSSVFFAYRLQ